MKLYTDPTNGNKRKFYVSTIVKLAILLLVGIFIIQGAMLLINQLPAKESTDVVNAITPAIALPTEVLTATSKPIITLTPTSDPITTVSSAVPTATRRPTYTEAPSPTIPPPPHPPTLSPTNTPIPTIPPPINTPVPALGRGSIITSEKDGAHLLYVPAGEFQMGSAEDSPLAYDDEKPRHTVNLSAYFLDLTEVTNTMFARFVEETGHETEAEKEGSGHVCKGRDCKYIDGANWQHPQGPESDLTGLEAHPVVQVSWDDANAYCQWAGRRLPTEAQWEKAAGGTDGRIWPWGNEPPNENLANFNTHEKTRPVGSYSMGVSPYGVLDMAGNVSEWISDNYDENYYRSSPKDNPQGPEFSEYKVARFSNWWASARLIRVRFRNVSKPNFRDEDWGFRCVLSVE